MEQEITVINGSEWMLWLYLTGVCVIVAVVTHLITKYYLLKDAEEFDEAPEQFKSVDAFIKEFCGECEHESVIFKIGVKFYYTEEGARIRCENLYKRHNVNAEITLIFANENTVKCRALDIWEFNR